MSSWARLLGKHQVCHINCAAFLLRGVEAWHLELRLYSLRPGVQTEAMEAERADVEGGAGDGAQEMESMRARVTALEEENDILALAATHEPELIADVKRQGVLCLQGSLVRLLVLLLVPLPLPLLL